MGQPRTTRTAYHIAYRVSGKDWAAWDGEDPNKQFSLRAVTDEDALRQFNAFKAELEKKGTCYHGLRLLKIVELVAEH